MLTTLTMPAMPTMPTMPTMLDIHSNTYIPTLSTITQNNTLHDL
jgi:hypothetical protein